MNKTIKVLIVMYAVVIGLSFTHHTIIYSKEKDLVIQKASWYDYKLVGKWGKVCFRNREDCYTAHHLVGASRDYKRGTTVRVCKLHSTDCVNVLITDYVENKARNIDLSSLAFSKIAPLGVGIIEVTIQKIDETRN